MEGCCVTMYCDDAAFTWLSSCLLLAPCQGPEPTVLLSPPLTPPRCPGPYARSYCFHCHTISSTTDLFSPALMRRNYLQASNKPRPPIHMQTRALTLGARRRPAVIQQKQRSSSGALDGGNEEEVEWLEVQAFVDQHFLRDLQGPVGWVARSYGEEKGKRRAVTLL